MPAVLLQRGFAFGFVGRLQLELHDRTGHVAEFVAAVEAGQFDGEIAFPEFGEGRRHRDQRRGHLARNDDGDRPQQGNDDQRSDNHVARAFPHLGLQIVDVHPGSDGPVPRREAGHEGKLRLRCVLAWLGPLVVDEAAAVALHQHRGVIKNRLAGGVLDSFDILTNQLRLDRVHDHLAEIVDPEVVAIAIAHLADAGRGPLLCRCLRRIVPLRRLKLFLATSTASCPR